MVAELELPGLLGHNPVGLLAALGTLDVTSRALPDRPVTLRWTDSLEPIAVLRGPDSIDHLTALCDDDRLHWSGSPVLRWPDEDPLDDVKTTPETLRRWVAEVVGSVLAVGRPEGRPWADLCLLNGLVAEGALAGKGDTKPTHLHFTAGQQKFLAMARELQAGVDVERFREAVGGPWRYDSPLPSFGWDARGERIHALRGVKPSSEKRLSVPGAEWLGLLGLRFFPVTVIDGQLVTTGCDGSWKLGTFTWPLWCVDLPSPTVLALLADRSVAQLPRAQRRRLGVHHVLRSAIRRSEQGGYGSFAASEPVISVGPPAERQPQGE